MEIRDRYSDVIARMPYRAAVRVKTETWAQWYNCDRRSDKLRPSAHWCEIQPACENGSGQG